MKTAQPSLSTFRPGRHLRILDEKAHDPYQVQERLAEPAVCDTCGASYAQGRWQWATPSTDAVQTCCPACRRIHDQQPAAFVIIEGAFACEHHDEIMDMIRHLEVREKADQPLQRIMSVHVVDNKLLIETTDFHLARRIGDALARAYSGDVKVHYNEAEHVLHLHWAR